MTPISVCAVWALADGLLEESRGRRLAPSPEGKNGCSMLAEPLLLTTHSSLRMILRWRS